MKAVNHHETAGEVEGQIFVTNETIKARAITSVEGGAEQERPR